MKTMDFQLQDTNLSIDESLLIDPIKKAESSTMKYGTIEMPISLRNTVSPKAKVLAWIVRDDGEVVSDARIITFKKCLENKVKLSWGSEKPEPGEKSSINLSAEPRSICSLGRISYKSFSC